jgi:hypothetical protein
MKGKLAVCSQGFLGVITENEPKPVVYKWCVACDQVSKAVGADVHDTVYCTCEKGVAYVGIHVGTGRAGEPWSSRNPQIIGMAVEAARLLQHKNEVLAGHPPVNTETL